MGVVKGSTQLAAVFNELISTGVITPQNIPASLPLTTQYANGTGAAEVDTIYAKQLSLVASTPQTLDLTSLTDLAGNSINFARVRELIVQVVDTTLGHDVILGDAASNAFSAFWGATGTETVYAGSYSHKSDPNSTGSGHGAVVDSTHKSLKIDPGSNSVVVNILIVGCSAVS